jgi:hypothetical protein
MEILQYLKNLEVIILSEISQALKDKYSPISLYETSKLAQFIDRENRLKVSEFWDEGFIA